MKRQLAEEEVKEEKLEMEKQDLPGGPEVRNPPANAGDRGSIPGPGRFYMPQGDRAHLPRLLKPTCLEPMPRNKKPPLTATRESPVQQ